MAHSEFMYRRQCELLETIGCVAFEGYVNTTERVAETDMFDESSDEEVEDWSQRHHLTSRRNWKFGVVSLWSKDSL